MKIFAEDVEAGTIQIIAETIGELHTLSKMQAKFDGDSLPYSGALFIETPENSEISLQIWLDATERGACTRAMCKQSKRNKKMLKCTKQRFGVELNKLTEIKRPRLNQ